jgi:hypothetical protein
MPTRRPRPSDVTDALRKHFGKPATPEVTEPESFPGVGDPPAERIVLYPGARPLPGMDSNR